MEQLSLSFSGYARKSDPDTAHAAARSFDTTDLENLVYQAIRSFGAGGCISDDVMEKLPHIPLVSISPQYSPLLKKGLIIDTGDRRPGNSGRGQRVMRAK